MVVIEKAGSFSSSTSSRKEKQTRSSQKDNHELLKGKLVRKTSSFSSSSSPCKKEKQSASCVKDSHELLKEKLTVRGNSFSSPSSPSSRKGKQSMISSPKDGNNDLRKEKLVRRASSLSSTFNSSTKREVKGASTTSEKTRKSSSLIKSRIKELGPICKKRKEILNSIQVEEDIDVYLDRQIEEEGKVNPNDCLWLTSGSMSPQEFGLYMSALDPCLDEWVLSFLPRSSRTPNAFDGSKVKTITTSCETSSSGEVDQEEEISGVNGLSLARSQSIDSSCSSSLALSTYTDSSSFWNMDRTGVWVSLINLDGEDSKFISDVNSHLDELESNFPSPNYEINWDSYSSDVGVASSAKSTQESASQSEWSSDLLSDSMDWELDSDDPIFWPFGVDVDWDHQGSDSFSVSPRKGIYKIRFESGEDGCATPDSIRLRLQGKNGKRILFMSGLSASKIIEFKKGCRKNATRVKRCSKIGKRASHYKRRVPPILENDLEGISPKDTPKESVRKGNRSSDIDVSDCADNWGDEMDTDGPLFWPIDQKTDWDLSLDDSFNISPRKISQSATTLISSPKGGFSVSSSVRLKFRPKKMKYKASVYNTKSGFGAIKSFKKTNNAASAGGKSLVVMVPGKTTSLFKSNKLSFKHGRNGKKKRDLPLKVCKSLEEFIRLVSIIGMNKMFPGVTSEELPIETLVGLNEFDGHEGVDMEFEDEAFSLQD